MTTEQETYTPEDDARWWRLFGCEAHVRHDADLDHPYVRCDRQDVEHQLRLHPVVLVCAPVLSGAAWGAVPVMLELLASWPEGDYRRVRFMTAWSAHLDLNPNDAGKYWSLMTLTKLDPRALALALAEAVRS